jgi:hypothetical protein
MRKILVSTLALLMVYSCTATAPNTLVKNQNSAGRLNSFSTKDLSESYLERKVAKWLIEEKGAQLVKEIKYFIQKDPVLLGNVIKNVPGRYEQIIEIEQVKSEISFNPAFAAFINSLAPAPAWDFEMDGTQASIDNILLKGFNVNSQGISQSFSNGVLSLNFPDTRNGGCCNQGGNFQIVNSSRVVPDSPGEFIAEFRVRDLNYNTPGNNRRIMLIAANNNYASQMLNIGLSPGSVNLLGNAVTEQTFDLPAPIDGNFKTYKLKMYGMTMEAYVDGTLVATIPQVLFPNNPGHGEFVFSIENMNNSAGTVEIDFVRGIAP